MSDLVTITWHEAERVVESRLRGKWTVDDVHAYYAEVRDRVLRDAGTGTFGVLTDLSDYPLQPVEVSDAHQSMLHRIEQNGSITRVAWVASTRTIAGMQHRRNATEADVGIQVFTSHEDAWAFLGYPDSAPA